MVIKNGKYGVSNIREGLLTFNYEECLNCLDEF